MAVLYRKYRPQTFAQVAGQKHIIKTLQNQVTTGLVSHAYLFTGSRGVGKTSVARILAKAVNCKFRDTDQNGTVNQPLSDACGECEVCRQIEVGNFIDLTEIDAASNTGVDNIRELIERVNFAPGIGKYKVYIIDEVHMLSKGAFNALLKTLEEPPSHAIFILATTEIAKVPATIISRTQRFDFRALDLEEIQKYLSEIAKKENAELPESAIELVAKGAEGGLRDALSLMDKILTLGSNASEAEIRTLLGVTDEANCEKLFSLIVEGKTFEIGEFFENLEVMGVDFLVFSRDFLEYLRKILVNISIGQSLRTKTVSLAEIIHISRLFLRAHKEISGSPDASLPLLIAALEAVKKPGLVQPVATTKSPVDNSAEEEKKSPLQPIISSTSVPEKAVKKVEQVLESQLSKEVMLEEVRIFWPAVVDSIRKINAALANLVRTSELLNVSAGTVILGVKYPFHKQSLESAKNREIILKCLNSASGKNLALLCKVLKTEEVAPESPDQALVNALQVFGGEIVK